MHPIQVLYSPSRNDRCVIAFRVSPVTVIILMQRRLIQMSQFDMRLEELEASFRSVNSTFWYKTGQEYAFILCPSVVLGKRSSAMRIHQPDSSLFGATHNREHVFTRHL